MNFRKTTFLFGLLLSMLWVFGLMLAFKKSTFDSLRILPTLEDAVVDTVIVERKDTVGKGKSELFQFVKSGDDWMLKIGENKFRIEKDRIDKIVQEVKTAVKSDEERVSTDSAENGLDHPRFIVKIKGIVKAGKKAETPEALAEKDKEKGTGKKPEKLFEPKEWELKIGNTNAAKTAVFVTSSDRPQRVFAVARSAFESLFFTDVNQFRSKDLFQLGELAVKKVLVKDAKDTLEIKRGDDETWLFEKPAFVGPADYESPPPATVASGNVKPEQGGVKGLIGSIRDLRVQSDDDFIPPSADPDLAQYGLGEGKESLRAQLSSTDGKTEEVLLIGSKTADTEEKYFARLQNDMGVFKLSGNRLKILRDALGNPSQFRNKDVTTVNSKNVDKIKLTIVGKETIELTRSENKLWKIRTTGGKPAKANEGAVRVLLNALEGQREIKSFLENTAEQLKKFDAKKEVEIELFATKPPSKLDFNEENKDDKKKDEKLKSKLAFTLTFGGMMEKDNVVVKRALPDGGPMLFTIAKSLADKINPPDPQFVYLDTALPNFSADDAQSLTLDRGKGPPDEVVRGTGDNAAGCWVFKKSPGKSEVLLAKTIAVNGLLQDLGQLRALKWVRKIDADANTKIDLAKMGLDQPAILATVVVKKMQPLVAAEAVGMLGSGNDLAAFLAASSLLGNREIESGPLTAAGAVGLLGSTNDPAALLAASSWIGNREVQPGEIIEIRFGKETNDDKGKPAIYACHSGANLVFLVEPDVVQRLKSADLSDYSRINFAQNFFDASAVAQGQWDLLAKAPLLCGNVVSLDPAKAAKVKDIRLELRTSMFHFVRNNKTWEDQSGLKGFEPDSEKVNALLEKLTKLQWDPQVARLVTLVDGPQPDYKLGAKEVRLKLIVTLEKPKDAQDPPLVITLSVGDVFEGKAYFAHLSSSPQTVFLLSRSWVDPLLDVVGYFGKDRLAAGE